MVGTLQTFDLAFRLARLPRTASLVVTALTLVCAFVSALGCARQSNEIPRIGFLSSVPSAISEGFQEGLKERGLVEGRNVIIEWRWTEGKAERITELASELVDRGRTARQTPGGSWARLL